MQPFQFQIQLTSNIPGALSATNDKLDKTDAKTRKAAKGVELFEGELGKLESSMGGFKLDFSALSKGGSLLTFDLAEGAHLAGEAIEGLYEIVEKAVDAVIDLGKEMIKSAGNAQDLNLAVELDVGAEGVAKIDELAEKFAPTRFAPAKIKESLLPLMEEGIKDEGVLGDIATAATDLAARRKGGIEQVQAALGAFQRLALGGKVEGALRELSIRKVDFYADLGDLLKVSAKEAQKRVKEGTVDATTLTSIALNQVAKREGGELGTASLRAGQNLNGQIERLLALPERYMEKLANSPALGRLTVFMDNVLEALDPDSPQGLHIQASVERLFDRLMETFHVSGDAADGIGEAISSAIDLVGDLVPIVVDLARAFLSSASAIGEMVQGLRVVFAFASGDEEGAKSIIKEGIQRKIDDQKQQQRLGELMGERQQQAAEAGNVLGNAIGVGFADGISLAATPINNATLKLVKSVDRGVRVPLQIQSPSKVMERLGRYTAEGFARGLDAGSPMTSDVARRALAAVPEAAGAPAIAGLGGNQYTVKVEQNFHSNASDPRQVAMELAPQVRVELKKLFDEMGATVGVAA